MRKHQRKSLPVINIRSRRRVEEQYRWLSGTENKLYEHAIILGIVHGRLEVVQQGKELGCSEISKNMYSRRLPPAFFHV